MSEEASAVGDLLASGVWRDQAWRLDHLYWIEQKNGPPCRFKMNWAQRELFANMHSRNNILKARQLGISTLTALLMLDCCLFNRNFHAGIVDKTADDAKEKMAKIRFAVQAMADAPDGADSELATFCRLTVKAMNPQVSATAATFANGSTIRTGTSLRGGTLQLLHISEFGHVAANFPQKAREIISGSLNTVPANGRVIMESTHEGGKYGENYRMTKKAMEMVGKPLGELDFRFFFFPWWKQPEYRVPGEGEPFMEQELREYFTALENECGVTLDNEQKRWYLAQESVMGAMVRQEYPSTPDEAFQARVEGAIYGSVISRLRAEGRMAAEFEAEADMPLYVSWDIGLADYMSLWLVQPTGTGKFLVLDHYCANNRELAHYIGVVRRWEGKFGQAVACHFLPHDAAQRDKVSGASFQSYFQKQGLANRIVPRTPDVWVGIDTTRRFLKFCVFHARCSDPVVVDGVEYLSGVNALENYQTGPAGQHGVERRQPLHNVCSHSSDAFRTFAEAWNAGFVGRGGAAGSVDGVARPKQNGYSVRGLLGVVRKGIARGVRWG